MALDEQHAAGGGVVGSVSTKSLVDELIERKKKHLEKIRRKLETQAQQSAESADPEDSANGRTKKKVRSSVIEEKKHKRLKQKIKDLEQELKSLQLQQEQELRDEQEPSPEPYRVEEEEAGPLGKRRRKSIDYGEEGKGHHQLSDDKGQTIGGSKAITQPPGDKESPAPGHQDHKQENDEEREDAVSPPPVVIVKRRPYASKQRFPTPVPQSEELVTPPPNQPLPKEEWIMCPDATKVPFPDHTLSKAEHFLPLLAAEPTLRGRRKRKALEIGGPTHHFFNMPEFSFYKQLDTLDNVLYSSNTIWEGQVKDQFRWRDDKPLGKQFVNEATNMKDVPDDTYDIVISSHNVEHSANPVRCLTEFKRVLKPGGMLVLLLPRKEIIFDRLRDFDPLQELIRDYNQDTNEADLSHLETILKTHDFSKDSGIDHSPANRPRKFHERSLKNYENRALHHHVFNTMTIQQIFHCIGLVTFFADGLGNSLRFLARKPEDPDKADLLSGPEDDTLTEVTTNFQKWSKYISSRVSGGRVRSPQQAHAQIQEGQRRARQRPGLEASAPSAQALQAARTVNEEDLNAVPPTPPPNDPLPASEQLKCPDTTEVTFSKNDKTLSKSELLYPMLAAEPNLRGKGKRKAIEIGGPTMHFFNHPAMSLYEQLDTLDNVLFSSKTLWEGEVKSEFDWRPDKPLGKQFVNEATNMKDVPSDTYDFVLSSHNIEHSANPVRCLTEFKRVLKPGGVLVLFLPWKLGIFDNSRQEDPLQELIRDYNANTNEADLTHLEYILKHHNFDMDPGIHPNPRLRPNVFKQRSLQNFENRALHQHVFSVTTVQQVLSCIGMVTFFADEAGNSLRFLARKPHDHQEQKSSSDVLGGRNDPTLLEVEENFAKWNSYIKDLGGQPREAGAGPGRRRPPSARVPNALSRSSRVARPPTSPLNEEPTEQEEEQETSTLTPRAGQKRNSGRRSLERNEQSPRTPNMIIRRRRSSTPDYESPAETEQPYSAKKGAPSSPANHRRRVRRRSVKTVPDKEEETAPLEQKDDGTLFEGR